MNNRQAYIEKYGNVPDNIIDELVKSDEHIKYVNRKDPLGTAILYGDESELYSSNLIRFFSFYDAHKKPVIKCPYLSKALDELEMCRPFEYYLIINKFFSDDPKSYKDIAAERGVQVGTIYNVMSKAKSRLRSIAIAFKNDPNRKHRPVNEAWFK